jgi:thiol-disulfide isomerase/thioredoxin
MFRRMTAMTLALALCAGTALAQNSGKPDQKQQPGSKQPGTETPKEKKLGVGDKAPALTVKEWVKGEPITKLEASGVYVVEFWATWCGPCKTSIPHLTELQHKFKDVRFIGVSVWEPDQADVRPFVTKMGDQMDYRVATDDVPPFEGASAARKDKQRWAIEHGKMSRNWMEAAGRNGIPAAFVVKDGKIAWIGHPMSGLEEAIRKAVGAKADASLEPRIVLAAQPAGDKKADQPSDAKARQEAKVELPKLMIGDTAPELAVSKWVKGEPITGFEKGKTYVVEFWATWCGPCKVSIPHLTELQKEYKQVPFIGVSVWEADQARVEPFVKDMGEKMDYRVAMDDVPPRKEDEKRPQGKMDLGWMKASGSNGIPTAFIVHDGKVAWIGHPSQLDGPLAKVVSGEWDLTAEARKYRTMKENEARIRPLQQQFSEAMQAEDYDVALKALDQLAEIAPSDQAAVYASIKFRVLLTEKKDYDRAYAFGNTATDGVLHDNQMALNELAWLIVDPETADQIEKKDLKLALKAARRADELAKHKNAAIMDTLAKVYHDMGDLDKALELQAKAVDLAHGEEDEAILDELKDRLDQYKKEAAKASK